MAYRLLFISLLLFALGSSAQEAESRIWRSVRGMRIKAVFEKYEGGFVTLRRDDGRTLDIRFEELSPRDRGEVLKIAGPDASGATPAGQIDKPSGRRTSVWSALPASRDPWPTLLKPEERKALTDLSGSWRHAETQYFILHYQQESYARTLGRMADFFYEYIAADLRGFRDRVSEKSHIVVVRNPREWKRFMEAAGTAPEWATAYVYGPIMFVQDTGSGRDNADVVGHEMTHLVLNRFFVRPPPLWLNEGLAEWYGKSGWNAFRGQTVQPRRLFREKISQPMPLAELMSAKTYPENVGAFYATSRFLVGYLQLKRDTRDFVDFLRRVSNEGEDVMDVIGEIYGYRTLQDLERAFHAFAR